MRIYSILNGGQKRLEAALDRAASPKFRASLGSNSAKVLGPQSAFPQKNGEVLSEFALVPLIVMNNS
jgi:hypothetical protein